MRVPNIISPFMDSPEPDSLQAAIERWLRPEWPQELQSAIHSDITAGIREVFQELNTSLGKVSQRSAIRLEENIIDWLYDFIRLNVKRGRIFDLREVLKTGQADCLGYAKLLTILGRACGLDTGVVEVVIDNRGRNVPHTAALVRMRGGKKRFIDFWYGSRDIHHQRSGLRLKQGPQWHIEDVNFEDLKAAEDFSYLPDGCVDAITLYIEGNRSLKNREYARAVEQYTQAIALYPENARFFYNRAIASENLGQLEAARLDYAQALRDESSIIRTLATQPNDIVELIRLDEEHFSDTEQSIFLYYQGFMTGRKMSSAGIAKKTGLPEEEVKRIIKYITQRL